MHTITFDAANMSTHAVRVTYAVTKGIRVKNYSMGSPGVVSIVVALIQEQPYFRGHWGGHSPLRLQGCSDAALWGIPTHDGHSHAHHLSDLMQHERLPYNH